VFVQRATGLTCPRTLPSAWCRQDFDLGLNYFASHVALSNGTGGYHYVQMCSCSNQWGKDICRQWID
jgi:hypothetical protein